MKRIIVCTLLIILLFGCKLLKYKEKEHNDNYSHSKNIIYDLEKAGIEKEMKYNLGNEILNYQYISFFSFYNDFFYITNVDKIYVLNKKSLKSINVIKYHIEDVFINPNEIEHFSIRNIAVFKNKILIKIIYKMKSSSNENNINYLFLLSDIDGRNSRKIDFDKNNFPWNVILGYDIINESVYLFYLDTNIKREDKYYFRNYSYDMTNDSFTFKNDTIFYLEDYSDFLGIPYKY
ncbi:MAG TPA: hypothetical protein PK771_13240, partial [Spirochaetota bacterium]|nr:hypothetical protein [Spirochaetota bacterium]